VSWKWVDQSQQPHRPVDSNCEYRTPLRLRAQLQITFKQFRQTLDDEEPQSEPLRPITFWLSSCWNSSNTSLRFSTGMPRPVSQT
jgi:hypothetical protein